MRETKSIRYETIHISTNLVAVSNWYGLRTRMGERQRERNSAHLRNTPDDQLRTAVRIRWRCNDGDKNKLCFHQHQPPRKYPNRRAHITIMVKVEYVHKIHDDGGVRRPRLRREGFVFGGGCDALPH